MNAESARSYAQRASNGESFCFFCEDHKTAKNAQCMINRVVRQAEYSDVVTKIDDDCLLVYGTPHFQFIDW